MKKTLRIDPRSGIAADRFAAAMIGLGVPEKDLFKVVRSAAKEEGTLDVHAHLQILPDGSKAYQLHLADLRSGSPLSWEVASVLLRQALDRAEVAGEFADFALRSLDILRSNAGLSAPQGSEASVSLPVIGTAHTPYQDEAPYQPLKKGSAGVGAFYLDINPLYAAGLHELGSFTHIYILSYLHRSTDPELMVNPPWREENGEYGVFATRSPNRPSPIGLTRTRLYHLVGNRIYTGQLDLYDGTPILDIKPYIESLDSADSVDLGNDGWLEGSDHLELHRLGIPHPHPGTYQSSLQVTIALLAGIAYGLQILGVDLQTVHCSAQLAVGQASPDDQRVRSTLESQGIPYQRIDSPGGDTTPLGAVILAALEPVYDVEAVPAAGGGKGLGLGQEVQGGFPGSSPLILSLIG